MSNIMLVGLISKSSKLKFVDIIFRHILLNILFLIVGKIIFLKYF